MKEIHDLKRALRLLTFSLLVLVAPLWVLLARGVWK